MKLIFYLFVLPFALFCAYVIIINRNSKGMTLRQMVLKAVYPAYVWFSKKSSKGGLVLSNKSINPAISFYSLSDTLINGQPFSFEQLKGKKILLVNTASDCGYTEQYADLEKLSNRYPDKLVVIGFPSNDFNEQEKADDASIARFCKMNFDVNFSLMKKSVVIRGENQNKVYKWLTDESKNGWNSKQPSWNFCKYLVDENGKLIYFFGATVEPMDKEMIEAISK